MDRKTLLDRVDRPWREFVEAIGGLSVDVLQEPGVVDNWSVKDLLAHIATWEEEALSALKIIMAGEKTPRYASVGGIDAFNAMKWQHYHEASLEAARARFDQMHTRLLEFLQEVPEQFFEKETRFRRRLRLDTYGHVPEHTEQVRAWARRTPGT